MGWLLEGYLACRWELQQLQPPVLPLVLALLASAAAWGV
jgi:hypothetical protein